MATRIAVLGAGSWGTALAETEARAGHDISLWDRSSDRLAEIEKTGENRRYHPGVRLSPRVKTEASLERALHKADLVILAIPSQAIEETLAAAKPLLSRDAIFVCAAKGLDLETLTTLSSVARKVLGTDEADRRYAVLSGPSFAKETIAGLPTAVTVASHDADTAKKVRDWCHTETFRIFTSDDIVGVEIAGALKNVVAIATGAVDGLGFGDNARAALITRSLAEISRIGRKMGANPLTFAGLSGLGDLILTCTGDLSRNRQVGIKLTQGKSLRTILREIGQVAEGIRTAKAAYRLAEKLQVEVPILRETYLALYEHKSAKQVVADLLALPPTDERD